MFEYLNLIMARVDVMFPIFSAFISSIHPGERPLKMFEKKGTFLIKTNLEVDLMNHFLSHLKWANHISSLLVQQNSNSARLHIGARGNNSLWQAKIRGHLQTNSYQSQSGSRKCYCVLKTLQPSHCSRHCFNELALPHFVAAKPRPSLTGPSRLKPVENDSDGSLLKWIR